MTLPLNQAATTDSQPDETLPADNADCYRESNQMIEELRAHADSCRGALPLGGCGLTVADILRRKAARRAAERPPVRFYSIEEAAAEMPEATATAVEGK